MINFIRIIGNIKLGDYLHSNGTIDNTLSSDIIGVCVISSNILPDRYARFISLGAISCCFWGRNIELKTDYKIDLLEKREGEILDWGFISDETGYRSLVNPYLPDNSFNPEFLKDLPRGNAFQDYKGYENMKLYKEKYGRDREPFNAFTKIIEKSPSYKKDDWYLPAIGELAFIPPRFNFIRNKITQALIMSSRGASLSGSIFWSSSECGFERAWNVALYSGFVGSYGKGNGNYVRAFLAI